MAIPKTRPVKDLLLAMAGAEERLQLVLGQPGPDGCTLLASRQWTVPGQSVRFLVPGLHAVLDEFGVDATVIDRIACVRGPGSFTGLRLVLAAAEGLAAGLGVPLAGIDHLPLLAAGPAPLASSPLHVLTYARRGLIYAQSFDAPSLKEIAPLASLGLDEAAERITTLGDTGLLLGSGLRKNQAFFADLAAANPGLVLLDETWDVPSPDLLLKAATKAAFARESIDPIYVRPSDAEDNLESIARKRGLDPAEARRRLDELRDK
ncbi:MAG: tRNA (adenosine(37)-N6)-threonylcarbamoyltransferase complex dimerization subunit type 1 TsaB [Desulfovibrionaceae bacterium]|nr:tRNA (adenosine(37)-N6)-threonylcarbamoyltransferase complex dimerization subunit type 1 TsaB [Desulfovibrionaceae bacterium]